MAKGDSQIYVKQVRSQLTFLPSPSQKRISSASTLAGFFHTIRPTSCPTPSLWTFQLHLPIRPGLLPSSSPQPHSGASPAHSQATFLPQLSCLPPICPKIPKQAASENFFPSQPTRSLPSQLPREAPQSSHQQPAIRLLFKSSTQRTTIPHQKTPNIGPIGKSRRKNLTSASPHLHRGPSGSATDIFGRLRRPELLLTPTTQSSLRQTSFSTFTHCNCNGRLCWRASRGH